MNNQVERILELMNVKILTESLVPPMRKIDDVINFLEKSGVGNDIEKWFRKIKKARIDGNVAEAEKLWKSIPKSKIVNRIFKTNFLEKIIPWNKRYDEYDKVIDRIQKKEISLDDARLAIQNKGGDFFKNIYNTIISANPNAPVSQALNDEIGREFSKKLLKEFDQYFKKISGGGTFNTAVRAMEPVSAKSFRQVLFRYWWTKEENFEKVIYEIQQEIQYRLKEGRKIDDIIDKLFNAITGFKRSALADTKKIVDKEILNNTNIPEKFKTNFRNENYIYKEFEPLANETVRSVLDSTFKQFIKRNLEILKLNKSIGWKRLLSTITWQTPQFLSEILANIVRNGKTATIVEKTAAYLVIHNFIIPLLIAAIKTPFQNQEYKDAKVEMDKISKLCKDGVLPKEACPTKEEMESIKPLQPKDFWAEMRRNVPLLEFFINEEGSHKFGDVLFWTWWDEIFSAFYDIWYNKSFSFDEKENAFKSRVKQVQDKVKLELEKNGFDPDNYEKSLKDFEMRVRNEKQEILKKGAEVKQKIDNTRLDTPQTIKRPKF
jgi:hypothetical protein